MEQILLTYGLPKETIAAIIMLYKNTEVKVRSPDGDTDYFDVVADVLSWQRKEAEDTLYKQLDPDYADDIALLANIPAQAETLLYSLEWAAAGIGLRVNTDEIECALYVLFKEASSH